MPVVLPEINDVINPVKKKGRPRSPGGGTGGISGKKSENRPGKVSAVAVKTVPGIIGRALHLRRFMDFLSRVRRGTIACRWSSSPLRFRILLATRVGKPGKHNHLRRLIIFSSLLAWLSMELARNNQIHFLPLNAVCIMNSLFESAAYVLG